MEKNHVVGKLKPCSDPAYEPLAVCPLVQGISASLGLRDLAQLGEAQSREGTFGTCKCSLETTSFTAHLTGSGGLKVPARDLMVGKETQVEL